jgi:5-(carboxyamino)imidazole ribonucleotide synthase
MLPPGSTIGMLGGGQLGRMAALAAAALGYKMHIFTPHEDDPAPESAAAATIAAWNDAAALEKFAAAVDVITLEFENVPVATVEFLTRLKPVFPGAEALKVAQDRVTEKSFINRLGIATAPWKQIDDLEDLLSGLRELNSLSVLKSRRMGYDGKGQTRINEPNNLRASWQTIGSVPAILESAIDFDCEVSIVLARGQEGQSVCYPLARNRHKNGILDTSTVPAGLPGNVETEAQSIATRIAEALHYVGVLAVEFFVIKDGALLVNEIAPRPHNSGHWTIDACVTSQFEQQIRAVAGLPLGPVTRLADAEMTNLIGEDALEWQKYLGREDAKLHLYGKKDIRPGRKMGHVTRLSPLKEKL